MTQASKHLYLISLGSNQRHTLIGTPPKILCEAMNALEMDDIDVFATSSIISSRPLGPSLRLFANAAALLATDLAPPALLARLKQVETHFGRRPSGQAWRQRILDLDIILWSGGIWTSANPALSIPHAHWDKRDFVIQPAAQIAPNWRDPISGKSIKQIEFQKKRSKRVDPTEKHL